MDKYTDKSKSKYKSVPLSTLLTNTSVKIADPVLKLNAEIKNIYAKIRLTDQEREAREKIFRRIKRAIEERLDCRVESFGSFRTAMQVYSSDIDITVLIKSHTSISTRRNNTNYGIDNNTNNIDINNSNDNTNNHIDNTNSNNNHMDNINNIDYNIDNKVGKREEYQDSKGVANAYLSRIHDIIMEADISTGQILHIKKAKTPILKLKDKKHKINIDISINKVDGIETAAYITKILKDRPYMEYFVIILKYFLKRRGLADTLSGGICSYGQFLLILSFVQLHPLIQNGNIDVAENLGVLLIDFFQYYGIDFPFERSAICVASKSFRSQKEAPLYIEDPIVPGNNVAAGCSSLNMLREVFVYSYRIVTAAIAQKVDINRSIADLWLRLDAREMRERETYFKSKKKSSK
ncbi:non-canonical poly(A) RNA polymerase PAPD5/7 [Enteropsectra breve]|nr:non-canonical poly(A) RNA polymerase PAPD5/7 [Enteropsectra breve]